ncbi:MAG: putative DNA binding domain-containing protein [Oscillospiraceae bacterium]|nr:putative DNA binding domain-containing protein [Oscillospiraceae bacterium]
MKLEFDIEDLLRKNNIESDRIEFKKGWNPDDIYRSICAFANDYDNLGGGYILVGVEEKEGIAVRPICGLPVNTIDKIQKEMVGYNRKIQPPYFAKLIPEKVDDKDIMVIWVPSGVQRPYKTTEHVTAKNDNNFKYFIRYGTSSVVATHEQERELLAMSAHEPFDVQGNSKATIDDISPLLLEEHLKATGSKLAKQIAKLGVKEVLDQMELLEGPPERQQIKNVALMMFCDHPDTFFPYMQVEIVRFPNGSIKDPKNFIEVPPIKGTVPQIIKRTMEKLQDIAISEYVQKVPDRMEANRYVSYPYETLEEAVVNAFYHRDYMCYEPVHIEIEPDCIRIISYPGIDRSISLSVIEKGERFKTRMYRNRRLGEFLKELDLTEGRCTGVPTIQEGLEKNGSPRAVFETDDDRRAVCVTIPIHPEYLKIRDVIDQNARIEDQNARIEDQNARIEDQNARIEVDNESSQIENTWENAKNKWIGYVRKETEMHQISNITAKAVIVVLEKLGENQNIGTSDVQKILECKETKALRIINEMKKHGILIPVYGQGKGKYSLNTMVEYS